jgi:hypothetical protein
MINEIIAIYAITDDLLKAMGRTCLFFKLGSLFLASV